MKNQTIQLQPMSPDLPVTIENITYLGNKIICGENAVLKNVKVVIIQN